MTRCKTTSPGPGRKPNGDAASTQVRAGRSLRPESWPGGNRCAVALSFDSDHDTNELRDGGRSIGRMSWGQYGNRVGVPRILELLKRSGIPATFFVPAVSALLYPDEQRARHRRRARDRAARLDSRAQFRPAREERTRAPSALGGRADRA